MPNVQVQHLSPADVDQLRALNGVFAEAFEDARTYLDAPPPDDPDWQHMDDGAYPVAAER